MAKSFSTIILACIYGYLSILKLLLRVIRVGRKKYFEVKPRETEPACLRDPALGNHGYLQAKDTKIHFVIKGDESKPLMLFIHGFPDFWFVWKNQIKEFANEYCVVAMDLRGYGKSDKKEKLSDYEAPYVVEDVVQVVKHFTKDSGKAIVVAHDWGGFIAYLLAEKYPELVSHLVVANVPHPLAFAWAIKKSWKQFFMSWYMFFFQLPYLPELSLKSEDLGFIDLAYRNKKRRFLTPEETEAYKYVYSQPGAFTHAINYYRANIGNSTKGKDRAQLRITCPMLLLWGDQDLALTIEGGAYSANFIDKFSMKVLKGVSHWSQLDAPDEFNAHIWTFLKAN